MSTCHAGVTSDTLELLKRSAAVPSMPHVVTRFLELARDTGFAYDDLAELLGTDPGIAGEILRLSNSALFGVARKVTSLRQALTLLGLKRIRSLVLSRYMVQAVGRSHKGGIDVSYLWRRSLAAAVLAARFADMLLPDQREEAFLSALLADIGVTILADNLPQRYRAIGEQYRPRRPYDLTEMERAAVGVTHADISAMVLEHWQVPALIARAVRHHHADVWPPGEEPDEQTLVCARIINASGRIAKLLCEKPQPGTAVDDCRIAMDLVGLDMQALADLVGKIESDIEELAEILCVDVVPSATYEMLAAEIREAISLSPR